jgi:hypothetical protein
MTLPELDLGNTFFRYRFQLPVQRRSYSWSLVHSWPFVYDQSLSQQEYYTHREWCYR